MVQFFENGAMKPKVYLFDYVVKGENCQPIIKITHDEYIFFVNDDI